MADPVQVTSTTNVILGGLGVFVGQFVLTLWNNRKTDAAKEDVKISTSSAEQVERLDTKVMGLQRQVSLLHEKLKKVLPPDDRGPT